MCLKTRCAKATVAVAEAPDVLEAEPNEEPSTPKTSNSTSLDLAAKAEDPVRLYLREMGTVPLLKREGEVAIAKRIERGATAGDEGYYPGLPSSLRNCSRPAKICAKARDRHETRPPDEELAQEIIDEEDPVHPADHRQDSKAP